jgi:hypothetical protein
MGINPIDALFWTAVLNGFLAPPLMVLIMLVANSRQVMGKHTNGRWINVLGWCATGGNVRRGGRADPDLGPGLIRTNAAGTPCCARNVSPAWRTMSHQFVHLTLRDVCASGQRRDDLLEDHLDRRGDRNRQEGADRSVHNRADQDAQDHRKRAHSDGVAHNAGDSVAADTEGSPK